MWMGTGRPRRGLLSWASLNKPVICNQGVTGSNPVAGTNNFKHLRGFRLHVRSAEVALTERLRNSPAGSKKILDGELPYWLRVTAALSTPAIAFLGFCIAWAQWANARSKLILDLYALRRKVYGEFYGPIGQAVRHGTSDTDNYFAFSRVLAEAKFLFGKDVMRYLRDIAKALNQLGYATSMLEGDRLVGELQKHLQIRHDCMLKVAEFFDEIDDRR